MPLFYATHNLFLSSSRTATLNKEHQLEALRILSRCHVSYLEVLCATFDLRSAPLASLVDLVKRSLEAKRLKEAVTFAYTFHIQHQFRMDQVSNAGMEWNGNSIVGGASLSDMCP